MNPHRLHYFAANAPLRPTLQPRTPTDMGRLMACGIAVFFLAVIALHVWVQLLVRADPAPRPQTPAEARIEGFRAGHAAAREQGCRAPVALSVPIAQAAP